MTYTSAINPWIDISMAVYAGMVRWPGDPEVRVEHTHDIQRGDPYTVSLLSMGSHAGTHIDAPLHFIQGGAGIDTMPAQITIGAARVLEIEDAEFVKPAELERYRIRQGERILFRTRNSQRRNRTATFLEDFVYISKEAAAYLAQRKVRVVGVDYLSVGGYKRDGVETHRALLGGGVWIIEGLDLSQVNPGAYDLVCLPIKLREGDGAPARAFLRARQTR